MSTAENVAGATARLGAFLAGRTIGAGMFGNPDHEGALHWRGPGYDDGWEDLTGVEVRTLVALFVSLALEMTGPLEAPQDPPLIDERLTQIEWRVEAMESGRVRDVQLSADDARFLLDMIKSTR